MKQTLRLRGELYPENKPLIYPFYRIFIILTIVLVSCVCSRAQVPTSSPEAGPAAGAVKQPRNTINGRVVSAKDGKPLQGATIKNKLTGISTSTDFQGKFEIEVMKGNILIISYLGYESQEITVTEKSSLIINLSKVLNELDETVVIGYGTTSKRFNTGSVSKITADEIGKQPVSNPLAALQGRAAGVYINTENGLPGGGFTVQIRGVNSIAAGRDPLYIIDGVPIDPTSPNSFTVSLSHTSVGPISPLSAINPQDIKSIEILKDADATAIYGSRGANGVVLITTKSALEAGTTIELNARHGVSQVARFPHYLNLEEYLMLRREAYENDHLIPSDDPGNPNYAPDLMVWDTLRSTDWVEYMIGGTAPLSQLQLSVSGGDEATKFLVSANYRNEGSIFPGDFDYSKIGTHFNVRHQSRNKKLDVAFAGNFNYDRNNQIAFPVNIVLSLPPNFPLYEPTGELNWNSVSLNPLALLQQRQSFKTFNTRINGTFQYAPIDNLSIKTDIGYSTNSMRQINSYPLSSQSPNSYLPPRNYSQFGNNISESFIIEPQLHYKKQYQKTTFSALVGASYQTTALNGQFIEGENYANEGLLKSLGAAGNIASKYDVLNAYEYVSVFGRLSVDFSKKYWVNLTARRDGSSRFGPGNRFGNFGALGAAWIFSEESLVKNELTFISFGKLRSSYGLTGNDQISDYQYLSAYRPSQIYQGISTLAPARIANANYSWETNKKFDLGLDLGLFNSKLMITLDYFKNISGNQLVSYPLPYMSGPFGSYQANLPAKVENSGWEVDIRSKNVQKSNVSWTSGFTITLPKNKLLAFPELEKTSYANTLIVGEDLTVIRGFQSVGISEETGLRLYRTKNGEPTSKPTRVDDYFILGKTSPHFYGGFSNTFSYKGFQLDVFFQFSKRFIRGNTINPGTESNTYRLALERWQHPGSTALFPKASNRSDRNVLVSDVPLINAQYARLKNLAVSYSLPTNVSQTLGLSQARIYAQGQNLFTIMKESSIYDPEIGITGIPPMRTIIMGVQLLF